MSVAIFFSSRFHHMPVSSTSNLIIALFPLVCKSYPRYDRENVTFRSAERLQNCGCVFGGNPAVYCMETDEETYGAEVRAKYGPDASERSRHRRHKPGKQGSGTYRNAAQRMAGIDLEKVYERGATDREKCSPFLHFSRSLFFQ